MAKSMFVYNSILIAVAGLLFLMLLFPATAYAQTNKVEPYLPHDNSFLFKVDIADLAKSDKNYDGKTVEVTGEVIGDLIKAEEDPNYCWITLTSLDIRTDTVAVYMPISDAQQIDQFGKYQTRGTTLKIKGTYYVGCTRHSGITCLHATNVSVVEPGSYTPSEFDPLMFLPGIFAVAIGFMLMFLYRRIAKSRK